MNNPYLKNAESQVICQNLLEAKTHFRVVKKRLLTINSWDFFSGNKVAYFSLRDGNDDLISRMPKTGDYIKIKLPSFPNPKSKFDWVQIESIFQEKTNESEIIKIKVHPVPDPTDPSASVSHFYNENTHSIFVVKREQHVVTSMVLSNEKKPNVKHTSFLETIRNLLVSVGGKILGSKFQWKSLTDGLVQMNQ